VLGPGNSCDFFFRSSYVGDLADMQQVVQMATGREEGGEEVVYPTAVEWNEKMQTSRRLVVPAASGDDAAATSDAVEPKRINPHLNISNISVHGHHHSTLGPVNKQSSTSSTTAYVAVLLIGVLIPFILDASSSAVLKLVLTVVAAYLAYFAILSSYHAPAVTTESQTPKKCPFAAFSAAPTTPANTTSTGRSSDTDSGNGSGGSNVKGEEYDVRLMSISEVDKMVLSGGGQACECGFMKVPG
jgi:hypothetical protein